MGGAAGVLRRLLWWDVTNAAPRPSPRAVGSRAAAAGDRGITETVGAALLIGLGITWGQPGWFVLGAIVTLAGFVCARIERWTAAPPEAAVVPA
jgi:hypothetical protein